MEEGLLCKSRHCGGTQPLARDVKPKQGGNGEEIPHFLSPPPL